MRFYILRRLHFEASALSLRVYRFHHCRKARIAQRLFKSAADHICRVAFEAASQSFSHLSFGVTDLGGLCGNKVRESELCACHHYGRHRKIRTYRIDRGNSAQIYRDAEYRSQQSYNCSRPLRIREPCNIQLRLSARCPRPVSEFFS